MPTQDRKEIKIGKGGLEARLYLVPMPLETGGYLVPSLAELDVWIREEGIKNGIDHTAIQSAIEKAKEGLTAVVVAARGQAPKPGENGSIEYLVELEQSHTQTITDTGAIDMRASLIRNIQPGEPLAVIHPPTPGQPGMDVYGQPIAPVAGKAYDPRIGLNVHRSPNDNNLLIAQTAGHVRVTDGRLEIEEFYLAPGDIDYGTGNIAFAKAVLVKGDVKSGFSVDSGGDLEVTGQVEDCQVKSQANVLIRGGFTGQGKGLIQAQGNITLGYIRNQHVKAEKAIVVFKEAVNSRLQARQTVTVNGLLAGGKVQARDNIDCQIAGTETGTPTQLEAGYDYIVVEEMADIRLEMTMMGGYTKKLETYLRQIHDMEKLSRGLEPSTIDLMFEMEGGRSKVEAKIRALRERFSVLENQATAPEGSTITVRRRIFPGVVVKIGKEVLLVEERMVGPKTFFSKDGVIKVR